MSNSINPPKPPDFDEAVKVLLGEPAVGYLKTLRSEIERDRQYLYYHEVSVEIEVQRLLHNKGVRWYDDVYQIYWTQVVQEALEKLRHHR